MYHWTQSRSRIRHIRTRKGLGSGGARDVQCGKGGKDYYRALLEAGVHKAPKPSR